MNTARLLVPIFTLQDFLYLLLDFLLAGFHFEPHAGFSSQSGPRLRRIFLGQFLIFIFNPENKSVKNKKNR